jgi:hypothetical protein
MTRTVHGSCHCGAVRFQAEIDLDESSRCNCSVCKKQRFWKAIARPGTFKLLAGEEALSEYTFGAATIHHFFCRRCGTKPFGRGEHEALGGVFYAVSMACLDDVTDEELAAARVEYQDGKHDRWEQPPAVTAHL